MRDGMINRVAQGELGDKEKIWVSMISDDILAEVEESYPIFEDAMVEEKGWDSDEFLDGISFSDIDKVLDEIASAIISVLDKHNIDRLMFEKA